jgi:hypothetical protein
LKKILFFLLFISSTAFGQQVQVLLQGEDADSSFYHLAKIQQNEYWVGGEYGILKKVDTLGNISSISYPNEGFDILKIIRANDYIFIVTSNAVIYRYDMNQKKFLKKEFPQFKNKCFYDIIALQDGNLMVCGGASGITKAEKIIPKGFIAIIDPDLNNITTVWKNYRKFVWSLNENPQGEVFAATFNGFNTSIIKSNNFNNWTTDSKIKGLVHEISRFNGALWFCGTKTIKFQKDGIFGLKGNGKKQLVLNQSGCLWSMESMDDHIIAATQNGNLLKINPKTFQTSPIVIPNAFCLYDVKKISEKKLLVVGHGKGAYILDFNHNLLP